MRHARVVRFILAWAPLALWLGVIFFVSSRSTLPNPVPPVAQAGWLGQHWSTLAHVAEYAVLGALAYRAARTVQPHRRAGVMALLFGLAVALLDEAFQSTVPGRVAETADVLADGLGVLVVLLAAEGWRSWRAWTKNATASP